MKKSDDKDLKVTLTLEQLRKVINESGLVSYKVYTLIAYYQMNGRLNKHRFRVVAANEEDAIKDIRFKMRKTLSPYHQSLGITPDNVGVAVIQVTEI